MFLYARGMQLWQSCRNYFAAEKNYNDKILIDLFLKTFPNV